MKFIYSAVCFFTMLTQAGAQTPRPSMPDRPKLVLGLVVDQMRWDYLYRFMDQYGEGGFKRLLREGYSFENAQIPYSTAVTGAGHATLYTGTVPALHGIVGNNWIDRNTGAQVYCAKDTTVQTIGAPGAAGLMSPANLLASTIGDELRLASNFRSRVFGISLKDRGGILPAGQSANAAYWLDDKTGNWISSSWYMNQLPDWVNAYNRNRKVDSLLLKTWDLTKDSMHYGQSNADNNAYEISLAHEKSVVFPHQYAGQIGKNYLAIRQSPFGNTLSFDFGRKLIEQENLGGREFTDMLCVSLSSPDYVGHLFGTHSREIQDLYMRLDQELATFLQYLDKRYGRDGYLFFLSADHGVAHTPAMMKERKFAAGAMGASAMTRTLNDRIREETGAEKAILGIIEYQVYLNHHVLDSLKADKKRIRRIILDYLVNRHEVLTAFSYDEFSEVVLPTYIRSLYENGYLRSRSGDIQFLLRPHFTDGSATGAEHGTLYQYDSHIPMLFFGWKVKKGKSYRQVNMTDLAPTVAALLQIQAPPATTGRVLEEVMP